MVLIPATTHLLRFLWGYSWCSWGEGTQRYYPILSGIKGSLEGKDTSYQCSTVQEKVEERLPRSRDGLHSEPQQGKYDTVKKAVGWGCSDKGSYSQGRNDSRLDVSCLILILFFNSLSIYFYVSSRDFCFVFGLSLTFIIIKIGFWGFDLQQAGHGLDLLFLIFAGSHQPSLKIYPCPPQQSLAPVFFGMSRQAADGPFPHIIQGPTHVSVSHPIWTRKYTRKKGQGISALLFIFFFKSVSSWLMM